MLSHIDEGILALAVSFILYSVSLLSRGKSSIAHKLLYNDLVLLSPTNECVALIAGVSVAKETIPTSLKERLASLEISSKRVTNGMIALNAMTRGNSGGSINSDDKVIGHDSTLWKTLERTCCLLLGCALIFFVQWIRYLIGSPCCSDLTCWKQFLKDEKTSSIIAVGLLFVTLSSILSLGKRGSRIPPPSAFRYSPSSYLIGWTSAISILWFNSSITLALEELAVRILLLSRLLGVRIEDEFTAMQTLQQIELYFISFLIGRVGFVSSDPIFSSIDLVLYRYFSWYQIKDESKVIRTVHLILLILVVVLPFITLLAFRHIFLRHNLLGLWCLSLIFLAKPLLQTHLSRAMSAVVGELDTSSSEITSEKILHPFKSRRNQLVSMGAKILTTPSLLAVSLIFAKLCSNDGIYPIPYGGSMTPAYAEVYYELQAVNRSLMVENSTSCEQLPSTVDKKQRSNKKNNKLPIVNRGKDLLKDSSIIPVTIAGALAQLQRGASTTGESDAHLDSDQEGINDRQYYYLEERKIIDAIIKHPLITSTVAVPILDLFNWYLMLLWCLSMFSGILFSFNMRQEIKSCKISSEKHPKST